jgi:hypothetical protein
VCNGKEANVKKNLASKELIFFVNLYFKNNHFLDKLIFYDNFSATFFVWEATVVLLGPKFP